MGVLGEEGVAAAGGLGEELGIFGKGAKLGEGRVVLEASGGAIGTGDGFAEQLEGYVILAAKEVVRSHDVVNLGIGHGHSLGYKFRDDAGDGSGRGIAEARGQDFGAKIPRIRLELPSRDQIALPHVKPSESGIGPLGAGVLTGKFDGTWNVAELHEDLGAGAQAIVAGIDGQSGVAFMGGAIHVSPITKNVGQSEMSFGLIGMAVHESLAVLISTGEIAAFRQIGDQLTGGVNQVGVQRQGALIGKVRLLEGSRSSVGIGVVVIVAETEGVPGGRVRGVHGDDTLE